MPPLEDDASEASPPAPNGRCVDVELESGEFVIYDRTNHRAWILSDDVVDLETVA